MYNWTDNYSKTFIPDKYGRWGKTCLWNDLKIGEVIRIDKMYRLMTFFPMNAEDMPFVIREYKSWQEAKTSLETLWGEFNKIIRWKP